MQRPPIVTLLLALTAACQAADAEPKKPGIEHQILAEKERMDAECARKLQIELAKENPALGAEYQQALATAILAHAGKPGPVDYGPVCQKLEEMTR